MTATAVTQEQLLLFNQTVQAYVNQHGITGNREMDTFLEAINIKHDAFSDEQRIMRFNLETSTGTIALVSTAGAYSGTDYNDSRTPHEEIYTTKEYGGTFKLARRNIGKLNVFIRQLSSSMTAEQAADAFLDGGYDKVIDGEMLAAMKTHIYTALKTVLDGATTDTVYGDTVIADTGTLLNIDNLEIQDVTADAEKAIDLVVENLMAQKDYNGNILNFTAPKFVIASSKAYIPLLKELKKSYVVNEFDKGLLDYWNSDIIIVRYDGADAKDAFFFTGDLPLKFISETPTPEFFAGFDADGNLTHHITFIYAFGWKARNGVVKVQAA
jgi:hypothetical protein